MDDSTLPKYSDLPIYQPMGMHCAWGLWGDDDQIGRVNILTPDVVAAASTEIVKGKVINLCLPTNLPSRPPYDGDKPGRKEYRHTMTSSKLGQDDFVDGFYLQGSTQWDGLRHIKARQYGYYNGFKEGAEPGGDKLGIEHWAEHGIVGRGVLVDVIGWMNANDRTDYGPRVGYPITPSDIEAILDTEGVSLRKGDVLMLRTGFMDVYLAASLEEREEIEAHRDQPGLHAGWQSAEFLWDSGVAAVLADNHAVEVVPGDPAVGFLHRHLIPMLGFPVGEYFDLSKLAADCQEDGRYTCMFMSAPLNFPGGVGSPGNALAIK